MWFRQEFSIAFQQNVFLVVYLLFPFATSDPGWLSACNLEIGSPGQKYSVLAEDCPHGVWLPESSSLECLCVNGLWVLGDDWCDEDYQLVYGNGHCFSIDTQVRKISYVGNPENPFETRDYVTTSKGHYFASLNETYDMFNGAVDFSNDQSVTVLRVKPQKDISVILDTENTGQSDSLCLKLSNLKKQSGMGEIGSISIYSLFAPVKNIEINDPCKSTKNPPEIPIGYTELQPGYILKVKNGQIVESSQSCASNCYIGNHERKERSTRQRKQRGRGNAMGRSAIKSRKNFIQLDLLDSDTIKNSTLNIDGDGTTGTGAVGAAADNCSDFNLFLKGALLSNDEKRQMVNEETRRVIKIETNLLLNGGKGPKIANNTVASRHWFMLQNVKKVFLKVCPPTQIPPFIINSAMRIFRYIFIHTRDSNPYGMHFEDKAQDIRIKDALETCFADGKPFEFHYKEFKDLTKCRNEFKNVTTAVKDAAGVETGNQTELKNITYCKCSTDLDIVNFTYPKLNRTEVTETPFTLNKTIFILSEKYRHFIAVSNSSDSSLNKHDFVTETIWKMINFAHYYCARNFENNPHDHSALFNKLESLFNNDIIYRWNNPSQKSAAIWKAFYTAYDLEKITTSLDACVAGAKELSDYPKWLTRPTHQTRAKRELEKPVMWDGNGFCLRNPWEPLYTLGLEVPRECHQRK